MTSSGAFRPFFAARSPTAIRPRSSTAPSPCSSRRWRRRSWGRRRSRAHVLSAPGRIGSFEPPLSLREIRRGMSGAQSRSVMATSAPSSPKADTDARSVPSWSSITSIPTRSEAQPVRSRPGVRPPQLLEGARWRVEHIADAWATRPVMPEAGRNAGDPDATTSPDPPEPGRAATQSTGPDLVASRRFAPRTGCPGDPTRRPRTRPGRRGARAAPPARRKRARLRGPPRAPRPSR